LVLVDSTNLRPLPDEREDADELAVDDDAGIRFSWQASQAEMREHPPRCPAPSVVLSAAPAR
jgi:hypothetical protein